MKIASIETIQLEEFPAIIWIQVKTDSGLVGLGETFFGPRAVAGCVHEMFAPMLMPDNGIARKNRYRGAIVSLKINDLQRRKPLEVSVVVPQKDDDRLVLQVVKKLLQAYSIKILLEQLEHALAKSTIERVEIMIASV